MSTAVRETVSMMGGALMASSRSEAFRQVGRARSLDLEAELTGREALRLLDASARAAHPTAEDEIPVMSLGGQRLRLAGARPAQALSMKDFRLAGVGNDGESDRAMYRRDDGEPVLFTFIPGQDGDFGTWLLWLPENLVEDEQAKPPEPREPRGLLKFLHRQTAAGTRGGRLP